MPHRLIARGRARTCTGSPPGDFKSPASAIPPPGRFRSTCPGASWLSTAGRFVAGALLPPARALLARGRAHRGGRFHLLPHAAHVVLVLDLPHQFLDDVLEGDDPDRLPDR